jgi:transposase
MRKRADLLAHVQHTKSHYHLPEIGQKSADKANRDGAAERVADLAGPKTLAVDLALITDDDELLQDLARSSLTTATHHEAHTLYLGQTVPGLGKMLSLALLYESHDIGRFPPVQDVVSCCRLVQWAKASAGTRLGTSGKDIGNAHRKWAFSEAAALCLRNNPAGQKDLARLANKRDNGQALTLLAHKRARAVYSMLKRQTAFDREMFRHGSGSRAGQPGASLDPPGISLSRACPTSCWTASLNAKVGLGLLSQSPGR